MMRFIESIRCFNGDLDNLFYHQQRVNQVFADFFPTSPILQLTKLIVPDEYSQGCIKCRIIYSYKLEDLQFIPYEIKPIRYLQLVEGSNCRYDYKFQDRQAINRLYAQRGDADDILLLKNGKITDSSYANVAFYDGQNWLTPAIPLLKGTRRQFLIDEGLIKVKEIYLDDIKHYSLIRLFNAMIPFEQGITLPITSIRSFL